MAIYLFVGEDRHVDTTFRAHLTKQGAMTSVAEFQSAYGDRYEWTTANVCGWVYYASTGDDAPSVRIERLEVYP